VAFDLRLLEIVRRAVATRSWSAGSEGGGLIQRKSGLRRISSALNSPQIVAILTSASDGDCPMAKGQMRSNKEKRKPKKEKDAKKK
jgi:hypothetical protein